MNDPRISDQSESGRFARRALRLPAMLIVLVAFGVVGVAGFAWAVWTGSDAQSYDFATADSLGSGNRPNVTASGSTATVSWTASTLASGATATGYTVARYDATTGAVQTVGGGCSGTISTLTCTELQVPDGAWQYTVTPQIGLWTGAESTKSLSSTVGTTTLVFTTPVRSTIAGVSTNTITVERQDGTGHVTTVGALSIDLASNSAAGTFRNAGDSATLSTITIADGASSTTFRYRDTLAGTATITAGAPIAPLTVTSAQQNVNVSNAPADHLSFTQQPSNSQAGSAFSTQPRVTVQDSFNNTVVTATTPITLTVSSGSPSTVTCTANTVSAISGTAIFAGCSMTKSGTYTLSASATGLTSATSASFNVTSAAATKLSFGVQPSNTAAGTSIAPAPAVRIEDAFGNLTASTASINVVLTTPAGATLSGTATRPGADGLATFDDLSVNRTGSYTLTASSTGLSAATSNSFSITAGAASKLTFVSQPSNAVAGASISPAVTVRIEDSFGNLTNSTAPVTVALSTPGTATISGTTTQSGVAGVATFSGLSVDKVGTYALTASGTGLTTGTSGNFTITVGAPSKLSFGTQPGNTVAGVTMSPSATVRIEDAFGNLTTSTSTVNIAITSPGGASLSGTTSRAATAGVATFSGLSINRTGTYTFTATRNGFTSGTSATFTITPGAANRLTFSAQPTNDVAGATIAPAVTVRIEDSSGNLTASTASVTVTLTTPSGATLSGTTSQTAVAGVSTFDDLSVNRTGTYTLSAASSGLTGTTSGTFTISAGAASKLTFLAQPSNTTGGISISPSVTVRVEDSFGNLTASTASVTVALTTPGTATLAGTTTRNAVSGLATFIGLSVNRPGTYTLTASGTGLTSATSNSFNITVGSAAQVAFTSDPLSAVAGTTLGTITVQIQDAGGNPTTSTASVSVALTTPAGATLSGTTSRTAVAGTSTFTGLSVNRIGTYTMTASSSGLNSDTSITFDISPAAAARLTFGTQPSNSTAGTSISPAITVRIEDSLGNLTTSTASVGVALTTPAGATLSGVTPQTATAGLASFPGLSVDKVGTYTLSATSTGLTSTTSSTFTISSAAPSKLTFGVQPSNATAGSSLSPSPTIRVEDSFGNLATSSVSVTVSLTTPGTATLSGTATRTVTTGTGTFTGLSVNRPGSYTLTATSTGLTSTTSTNFNITVGTAAQVAFTSDPTTAVAGTTLGTITAQIQDSSGNPITTSAAQVTIAIANNPGTGTLTGTTTTNAIAGTATFTGLTINKTGTGYTLNATSTGLTTDTSIAFNITPAPATKLTIGTQPNNTTAGTNLSPSVTVRIEDTFGNLTTSTASINIALTTPGTATLTGTTTRNSTAGTATFTGLSVNRPGTYTFTATSTGLTSTATNNFTITVGAASQIVFTTDPTSAVAGTTLGTITAQVQDAAGNLVTGSTANVTLAIGNNAGGTGAALLGTASRAAVAGVATFTSVSINKAGTGYTLTASSNGLNNDTSAAFNITAAAAAGIQWTSATPTCTGSVGSLTCSVPGVGNGGSFASGVVLVDSFGNAVVNSGSAITVAMTASVGTVSPSTLTIANGASTSASMTFTRTSNTNTNGLVTATISASGWTLSCSVPRF